jgi:hypothetical protein
MWKDTNRVTIALGILAHDAVVIAADTQVGITDYLKSDQSKISFTGRSSTGTREMGLAIAGAGTTAYTRHFQQQITRMAATMPALSHDDFESACSSHLIAFHDTHIVPCASVHSPPTISFVLGYYCEGAHKLWSTTENLLTESNSYATAGIGSVYANSLLGRLFLPMWPMDVRVAALLAAYVVHEVKLLIDGCGKHTDLVCVGPYHRHAIPRAQVEDMEGLFGRLIGIETGIMHRLISGKPDCVDADTLKNIEDVRDKMDRMWALAAHSLID